MAPDRRQHIDTKFVITTMITLLVAVGGGTLGSYIGTQTKTAVLENTVSRVESSVDDLVKQQAALAALISRSTVDTTRETTQLKTEMAAMAKELAELKDTMSQRDEDLADAIKLADLQMINFGKSIATIQGEMNAERRSTKGTMLRDKE